MDQQRTQLENGVQEIDAVKRKLQQNVSEVIDLNLTCFPVLALWQVESLFLGKIKLQNFRPTVVNKSKLEVCLYFFPIDKHV